MGLIYIKVRAQVSEVIDIRDGRAPPIPIIHLQVSPGVCPRVPVVRTGNPQHIVITLEYFPVYSVPEDDSSSLWVIRSQSCPNDFKRTSASRTSSRIRARTEFAFPCTSVAALATNVDVEFGASVVAPVEQGRAGRLLPCVIQRGAGSMEWSVQKDSSGSVAVPG